MLTKLLGIGLGLFILDFAFWKCVVDSDFVANTLLLPITLVYILINIYCIYYTMKLALNHENINK